MRDFASVHQHHREQPLECPSFQSLNLDLIILAVLFVIVGLCLICNGAKKRHRQLRQLRQASAAENAKATTVVPLAAIVDPENGKEEVVQVAVLATTSASATASTTTITRKGVRAARSVGGCCCCLLVTFLVSLVLTWLLVAIVFALLRSTLFFPAETAAACTPCSGDLSTITFDAPDPPADRSPYCCAYDPGSYLPVSQDAFVKTPGGDSVNYWVIGANGEAGLNGSHPTVLYSHGSGRTLAAAFRLHRYKFLSSLGLNVIAYDYPGYGKSTLGPNSKVGVDSAMRAFTAVYEIAAEAGPVQLYGRSMGTGVSLQAIATGAAPGTTGVVLESPFTSFNEQAAALGVSPLSQWVVSWILGDTFNNEHNVAGLATPLLVTMSESDDVIPFQQAVDVFQAAKKAADPAFVKLECVAHQADLVQAQEDALKKFYA